MSTVIWERDGTTVWAALKTNGDLEIAGQTLSARSENEYWLTVKAADVDKVTAALGGAPGSNVVGLLRANAEDVVRVGEKTWLANNSIPIEFWSHFDPPDFD